jgi:hypothetical protein
LAVAVDHHPDLSISMVAEAELDLVQVLLLQMQYELEEGEHKSQEVQRQLQHLFAQLHQQQVDHNTADLVRGTQQRIMKVAAVAAADSSVAAADIVMARNLMAVVVVAQVSYLVIV